MAPVLHTFPTSNINFNVIRKEFTSATNTLQDIKVSRQQEYFYLHYYNKSIINMKNSVWLYLEERTYTEIQQIILLLIMHV